VDKTENSELDEEDSWSIAEKKITKKETKKPAATVITPPIGKELCPQGARSDPVVAAKQRYPQHQGRPN
jgi:hypothetical protein